MPRIPLSTDASFDSKALHMDYAADGGKVPPKTPKTKAASKKEGLFEIS